MNATTANTRTIHTHDTPPTDKIMRIRRHIQIANATPTDTLTTAETERNKSIDNAKGAGNP